MDMGLPFPGYSRSGSADSANDYKKKSLSDDYKRRSYMEAEKYHDGEEDVAKFSPECYLLSFITTCGIIVMLLMLYSILHSMPYPDEKHVIPRYSSHERRHGVFVAMTENLDCSLYMKNLAAKGKLSMQAVMRSGIMCISSMVPYSAAGMFSTFSMMTFRQMSPDGLVRSTALKGIKEFANTNQNVDPNKNYTFEQYAEFRNSYLRLEDGTQNIQLHEYWVENTSSTHIKDLLNEWKRMTSDGNTSSVRRIRVSASLADWLSRTNTSDKRSWMESVGLVDTKSYTEQAIQLPVMDAKSLPISISEKPLDFISVRYAYLHPEQKEYFVTFFFYRYVGTMIPRTSSNLETSSIFSAFILSLITKILKPQLLWSLPSVEKEAYIMYLMLGSQQVAYELLPHTREWDGNDSKPLLISEQLLYQAGKILEKRNFTWPTRVRRPKFDRVTSLVLFSTTRYEEVAMTFTMSRGRPFATPSSSSNTSFSPFINTRTKTRSKLFTSAAEVMVFFEHFDASAKLRYLISASGSLRTVEAVSSVAVRMAAQNKDPGEAISDPSGYYDPRDGRFYCSHNNVAVLKMLHKDYGIPCYPVPTDDPDATDRFVSVVKVTEDQYKRILAAVSQREGELNYGVGF